MSTPTDQPSSAELRNRADTAEDEGHIGEAEALRAGADAMDSLAAMRAQRDRLAEALRRLLAAQAIGSGVRLSMMGNDWTTGEERDATEAARAALAELEGGAS